MADKLCPICNRPNDANAERCWFCQAELPKSEEANGESQENWLDSFRDQQTEPPPPQPESPETPATEPASSADEVPDWLARIRNREQEERQKSGDADAAPEVPSDAPDWLQEIRSGGAMAAQPEPTDAHSSEAEKSSDDSDEWLKSLTSWQEENSPKAEPAAQTSAESEPPVSPDTASFSPKENLSEASDADWLKEFMQAPQPENTEKESTQDEPTSEPAIDEAASETAAQPVDEEKTPSQEEAEPPQTAIEDDEPDWLADFKALNPAADLASQVIPPSKKDEDEKPAFDDSALLDWMSQQQERPQETNPPNVTTDSLPAESEVPSEAQPVEAEPESDESIAKAALPPWLQALRPARKPQTESKAITGGTNPLAGIEGALLQENIQQFYTKPQTYDAALTITENQKKRAQILQKLVQPYQWVGEEEPGKPRSKAWILRLAVCILLLAAVFVPNFVNSIPVSYPSLYPAEVIDMFNGINAIPAGTPVLLAAEFDGSLFGELSLSSQAALEHLMERNLPIATLSSTPAGNALLQEVLKKAEGNQTAYPLEQIVNFGYLPGGSMGLQALAADPHTALPKDVHMLDAWQNAPLQNVQRLADFGAVIVITENADTARFWIEQVQPALGQTPLYVIISAQSAPLLQPYYDSHQIGGYLAGLNSATIYEQLGKKIGIAAANYPAYQLSLLLVTALIFLGGVISLILPQNRQKGPSVKE